MRVTIDIEPAGASRPRGHEHVATLPKERGELRLEVLTDGRRVALEVGFWVDGRRVARNLFRDKAGELDALEDAVRAAREAQRSARRRARQG